VMRAADIAACWHHHRRKGLAQEPYIIEVASGLARTRRDSLKGTIAACDLPVFRIDSCFRGRDLQQKPRRSWPRSTGLVATFLPNIHELTRV
jgi:hypothetical protein